MIRYTTVQKQAQAEQIIERSRFIAHVAPVLSREEAEAFIAGIRSQYKDATHNVPAFVIGEHRQLQWASDDGEPAGTSGAPIVQMIVKEGLTNVVCVVTRYWGGIKLGTGGLVRAYTGTAKLGLCAAGVKTVKDMTILKVDLPYTALGKLQNLEQEQAFKIKEATYTDRVEAVLSFEPESRETIFSMLSDLTNGAFQILEEFSTLC